MASWERHTVVPNSHTFPDQCRATLQHDDYSDTEIPTIDLACYGSGDVVAKQAILSEVREACSEWGFFQVVNHGVSLQLLDRVRNQALKFFGLPLDVKRRVEKRPGEFSGFGHAIVQAGGVQPWAEGFYLSDFRKVDDASRTLWPHTYNPEFAASYREYEAEMTRLCMHLMGMLIATLDVADATGHFQKHVKGGSSLTRWNFYPACPEPQKTLGMNVHTDFTLLTILHLGDVGGLQVQKGGQWMAVKPRHDAFAINIGDMLQVLTNGLYRSVPHRAVVNKNEARLSLVYLFMPSAELEVVAAPELLEREGAEPLYRPFTFECYTKVKQMHFSNTLDHFACQK